MTWHKGALVAAGVLALIALSGCSSGPSHSSGSTAAAAGEQVLVGTFRLTPGSCGAAGTSGTYFRMINPGGTLSRGPFFENPDSTCSDKSYTLAVPGTDGGILTGQYQPNPTPAFDSQGDALATRIVDPQPFAAIKFSMSTNPVDPQTSTAVPAPSIEVDNGKISGQIEAWSAAWNNQYFNQGSPKPDGARPGLTTPLSGSYDGATHAFVLIWSSQVVGGPFNGFTGYWHLTGTFFPR